MVYSVTKYGAVGDGATNDAAAIQSAIDACNAAGGGRVVLEGGHTYYSSSIELKSNVELHLEQGRPSESALRYLHLFQPQRR